MVPKYVVGGINNLVLELKDCRQQIRFLEEDLNEPGCMTIVGAVGIFSSHLERLEAVSEGLRVAASSRSHSRVVTALLCAGQTLGAVAGD